MQAEVSVQDQHIKALQGQLKEAETLLASTIYQAKQKLANISRSSPVLSEDLIKYSHRISASNAVCAPLNWQQGDPRYITYGSTYSVWPKLPTCCQAPLPNRHGAEKWVVEQS